MASAGCELQKEENEALEEEHFARELQNLDIVKCQPSSHVWVGGNIGSPLISVVDRMMPQDVAVMELSSFQLELMDRSPQLAAVLNITPNHLDRHGTMQAYTAAKARILAFQTSQDVTVLGRDDPGAWSLVEKVRGRLLTFGLSGLLEGQDGTFIQEEAIWLRLAGQAVRVMPLESIQLRGEHNRLNVLAACAIAAGMGLPPQAMRKGVEEFSGVAHRLEFVRIWGGAAWYNDSIATAPERAMAAIRSFDEPLILLAGGRDKDLPWGAFAELVVQRVERLVLFGEAAEKILQAVQAAAQGAGSGPEISLSPDLHQAVLEAAKAVRPGYAVLLSPGGTSFDEFRDFEERGVCFAQWVKELP
jgi:UDP-N-acetylmuramoylalanine--D-glutamate ligase